jgi:hypothetical protein
MNRLLIAVVTTVLAWSSTCSQPFHREVSTIPVSVRGRTIELPFAGGINSPVYRFVDIDGDSDLDLFLFDNDLHTDFYRNNGSRSAARFELEPDAIPLPRFAIWFLFADLDGDGRVDLLADTEGTFIKYYRNTGSAAVPRFILESGLLSDTGGVPIFAGNNSLPAFIDIDGDSDLDFFSTNSLNGTFNFYQNVGTPALPRFAFITEYYAGISVIGDSCMQGGIASGVVLSSARHGASAISFADLDGDGSADLYLGDLFSRIVFEMKNAGTATLPDIQCSSNSFPEESPVQSGGFNLCEFHDIDHDGDLDMFVSVLAGIVERNGFWFLENAGDRLHHDFTLRTKEYLSVLDVGQSAHPVLGDLDGDGDLDMLSGSSDGLLWKFSNSGSPTQPAYTCDDTSFAGVSGGYTSAPALADIDADGDLDLFVGGFNGRIEFYRNAGSPAGPDFRREPFPTDTIGVLQYSSPSFADIDGDGDLDLFVGGSNGSIAMYRNDGDSVRFLPVFVTAMYDSIDVGERSSPFLRDLDNDGDPDMLVGSADGSLRCYRNDGTPTDASFVLANDHLAEIDPLADSVPAMGDVDDDGDEDLLVGTKKGGMHFYRNDLITGVRESPRIPSGISLRQNFPNPFNPTTTIRFELSAADFIRIHVFDIFGRSVGTPVEGRMPAGIHEFGFDGSALPSGVYFLRLEATGGSEIRRMILIK